MNHTEEKNLSVSPNIPAGKFLVVFDGVCNLCNGFVNFLIRHDQRDRLLFAMLPSTEKLFSQSEMRNKILAADSVALIADGKIYFRSTAVLKLLRKLGGGWKIFYVLMIIPKPIRDWVYDGVARNRYRCFGKRDVCRVPEEGVKKKFI